MAEYPNPLAQVPFQVAKGVRKNSAVINFKHSVQDLLNGTVHNVAFKRSVWLLDIELVDEWLVKQGEFKSGDMRAYIPALSLYKALKMVNEDDPTVKIGGVKKNLAELRGWSNVTGGIIIGNNNDTLEWHGTEYIIIKVEPKDFWNNYPGKFRLYLRSR